MVWLVAWRELRDQLRDWRIIFPMFVLTLVLPFLADLGAQAAINFTLTIWDAPDCREAGTVPADGGGVFPDHCFTGDCSGIFRWGEGTRDD